MKSLYMSAHALSSKYTLELLQPDSNARLLDLGCFDGDWTKVMAGKVRPRELYGIEILDGPAAKARALGIEVRADDLEKRWSYPDNYFDVVHSSFVIEHMNSIDNFVSETFRVLKPGGYALTTTENGSSWHNIIAAILGWQTFSSACCSTKTLGLGNPLSLHRGPSDHPVSMTHKVIFNYLGFREIYQTHGFGDLEMRGSGYYPLFSAFGNVDHRHAHFLVLKAKKPG